MNYYKMYQDYFEISNSLMEFHEIFYKFWTMGRPVFTDKIETAAVCFDKKHGKFLQFLFNPDFWDSLTNYERSYVIAHECLHIILNHGKRALNGNYAASSIAIDMVANHILSSNLGLKTTPKLLEGCHFETVFKDHKTINKNKSIEYYYNLIKDHIQDMPEGGNGCVTFSGDMFQEGVKPGEHGYLGDVDLDDLLGHVFGDKDTAKEVKDKINEESLKAGLGSLDNIYDVSKRQNVRSPIWRRFIRNVVNSKKGIIDREYNISDWAKVNKRTMLLPKDMLIPNYDSEKPDFKYEMWFFQDISGSCERYIQEFFNLAKSIPEKIFDVRFHTFDTVVKKVDLSTKTINGGGGTAFHPIEDFIQKTIKEENIHYPELVMIITDGYGTKVKPAKPHNWHWILTENNKECIDNRCNFMMYNEL